MAQTSSALDDAMNKIATMLGSGPVAAATGPTGVTAPSSGPPSQLDLEQRQHILNQIYYSLRIPPITHAVLLDMEQKLPDLVSMLHSLAGRPTAQAELNSLINASQPATRSDDDHQRFNDLAQVIAQDAFGSKDAKALPIVAIGLAFFMAGYTIAHQWKA